MPVLKYRPDVGSPWQVVGIADEGVNFSNPNLLDNWYFGNPVNQRGGKIALTGATYYSDTECKNSLGNLTGVISVTLDPSGSYKLEGYAAYVKASDVVDGYILEPGTAIYTFDRWKISYHGAYVYAKNGYLHFSATTGNNEIMQPMETDLSGKTVILSAIINDELYSTRPVTIPTDITSYNRYLASLNIPNVGTLIIWKLTTGHVAVSITTTTVTSFTIKAAKLELGDQQTLAHQDANGNWVLNEIPDYGEQLRQCQRYFTRIHIPANAFIPISMYGGELNKAHFNIRLPIMMRQKPSCAFNGTGRLVTSGGQTRTVTIIYTQEDGTTTDAIASTIEFDALPSGMSGWFDGRGSYDFYIDAIADL